MKTVKKIFTKEKEGLDDPHLAMLCLRTTPIDHNLPSPCELLNGRIYKSNLPAVSSGSNGDVNAFLQQRQDVYKSYHDRTAKELASLSPQQFEEGGSQLDDEAALQGRGSGIRVFVGQLCGERRNVRKRWPAS